MRAATYFKSLQLLVESLQLNASGIIKASLHGLCTMENDDTW